ncbi:hypothetical protein IFO69_13980 [Echinicola sp. CAU 1574]|uniref:GyrI-like small molecule binding domain-containing protein n=1 Tax=Echinicola arenosa TaxID=2774144 RepID=A0ABR9AM39_9BACT|nr:hypothetical protein [Echinicola arenosa]MBD8489863.1 hypothetical protein [Echinicola arenosa]
MKIAAIIVGVIALLGFGAFVYLGGFEEIPFRVEEVGDVRLYGLTYRGTPQDEGLKQTFEKVEGLKQSNPSAVLHTIYMIEPAGKLDTMQVFVGLDRLENSDGGNWEEKVIFVKSAVVADLKFNKLVMPRPAKVKDGIKGFAKEEGLALQGIYIDRLIAEDHVQVIAPIKSGN